MSFMQALFEQEGQAVITWRKAYSARRRAEEEEEEARCQSDNIAAMAALSAAFLCRTAVDQAADAYCRARDDLERAWHDYSEGLTPLPTVITTDADACTYDLSEAGAEAFVDSMVAGGVVADPLGWHQLGWIDPKKFVVWFLRRTQAIAIIEGHDE
jgi:hypothetical protein